MNAQRTAALGAGELRLAQSYLKVMGYFGNPDALHDPNVVNGHLDQRTAQAFAQFVQEHGQEYGLTSAQPTPMLANAIRQEGQEFIRQQAGTSPARGSAIALGDRCVDVGMLYDQQRPQRASRDQALRQLHPILRLPALSAIRDLEERQRIRVALVNGQRTPEQQENFVREGKSTSPPGATYHDYGLGLDIIPLDAHGRLIENPRDPRWAAVNRTMEAHGFYSLGRNTGWDFAHHEIRSSTSEMMRWPIGADGWKVIPADRIPAAWRQIILGGRDSGISHQPASPAEGAPSVTPPCVPYLTTVPVLNAPRF